MKEESNGTAHTDIRCLSKDASVAPTEDKGSAEVNAEKKAKKVNSLWTHTWQAKL